MFLIDLHRYTNRKGLVGFFFAYLKTANYRVIFWYRLHLAVKNVPVFHYLSDLAYWNVAFRRGVEIPSGVEIGSGLYLIHSGSVVINSSAVIGKNFTVVSSLNIGNVIRGENKGSPVIGDNVYVGANVCILGGVKVGNNVLIGANSVITKDVEDFSVVVGSPARVIGKSGSGEYIVRPVL